MNDRHRHAEQRMERAKAMMTRAAQATLERNPLADDFAWLALAELEAARAELAEASSPSVCTATGSEA